MYPILFKIGWFEVRSYSLMLMLSFLIGIFLAVRRARKAGVDPNSVIDLSIIIIISSLIGARALYVVFHLNEFKNKLFDIINPFQSDGSVGIDGMTVLGGVVLAILFSFIFLKYKKLPIMKIFNITTPSLALGIGITRIGCFFHGCCFGTKCDNFLGMIFPPFSPAGSMFPGIFIHPAQLYASFGGFLIFIILLLWEKIEFFKDKVFYLFLIMYGITRFTVDTFRYYEESMVFLSIGNFNLSVNQGISIIMLVFGLISIVYLRSKEKKQTQTL